MIRTSVSATSTRCAIAAVAASIDPHPLTGRPGERGEHRRRDRLSRDLKCDLGALRINLGLVPDRLEAGDTLPQIGVVQIGYAILDGIVQPLEPGNSNVGSSPR